MQRVTEMSLPHLAIEDMNFAADPAPQFKKAREQHPWIAKAVYGYVLTEYGAMRDILSMDDRLRPPHEGIMDLMQARGSRWEKFQMESVLALSGEHHKRVRDIVASAFTPRMANQHRGLMRERISALLDEWAPKGKFDFEEFASYFPISVMCRLVGASPTIIPRLRTSMETLGLSFNLIPGFLPKLNAACDVMDECINELLADKKKKGRANPPDLLDALLDAQASGGLTDAELNSLLIFIFVAGYDTSKNVLTMIMHQLLTRPEMYERCAKDFAYCQKVVEENIRFQNPGTSTRYTNEDVLYRDVLIPKDTMLFFPNSMIGRDPGTFPDPDKIDPERPNASRHMAFGGGIHMCLGQHIARAQIQEGFHLIAQRLKNPKLVGPIGWRPFPGTWGMKGLPIEFSPAPARTPEAVH
jgi:cytochrome P450